MIYEFVEIKETNGKYTASHDSRNKLVSEKTYSVFDVSGKICKRCRKKSTHPCDSCICKFKISDKVDRTANFSTWIEGLNLFLNVWNYTVCLYASAWYIYDTNKLSIIFRFFSDNIISIDVRLNYKDI